MTPRMLLPLVLVSGCGLSVGPKKEQRETHTLDLSAITAVHVQAGNGNVSVSPAGDATGSVTFTKRTSKLAVGRGSCHSEYHIDGTTLSVNVSEDSGAACEIDTQVWVAAASAVDVTVTDGNVSVTDMQGAVTVAAKDGNIDADLASPGGTGPACNGTFSSTDGNIKVSVKFAPASGHLALGTSDGNVKLGLAGGTAYQLTEHTSDGNFKNGFATTAGAPFTVDLSSHDGNLGVGPN